MTGDFYTKIACSELQADDREFYDEVVFMGSEEDLAKHNGEMLALLSMTDRFHFDQQRVGFFWNDEPECRTQYGLSEDKKYLMMLNGLNSLESHLELTGEHHKIEDLLYLVNLNLIKGTPRWSQRANYVIF